MYSSNKDISKEEIGVIAHTEEYFPLLCKLYLGDETEQKKLRFFEKPKEETEKEIKKLRQLCVENTVFCFFLFFITMIFVFRKYMEANNSKKKTVLEALQYTKHSNTNYK